MNRLLIVDDEVTIRDYIKFIIKEQNVSMDVYEAANGKEAVEKAGSLKPDVVLMDIRMPEMGGLEASREIKGAYPWMKIVILTAYDEFSYAREAIKIGVDDYLLKPISPHEFLDFINNFMVYRKDELCSFSETGRGSKDIEAELLKSIRSNEREDALANLEKILEDKTIRCLSSDELKIYYTELIGIIVRSITSCGIHEKVLSDAKRLAQSQIVSGETRDSIDRTIRDFVLKVISLVHEACMSPTDRSVMKAKHYIMSNYDKRIHLSDVSGHVNLSSCYLSRMFKQQSGLSFSEYLNRVRIDKAKEYIGNFDMSLREVSEKVGFEDFSYFSAVFQRYEGCLPSIYRKKIMA